MGIAGSDFFGISANLDYMRESDHQPLDGRKGPAMHTILAIALALSFMLPAGTTHRNNSKNTRTVNAGAQDCIIIVDPPGVICN